MRHHVLQYRSLAGAAALLLALCSLSFAQCSLATVHGTWAFQSHGTAMMAVPGSSAPGPVPFAGLGIMKVDYQGRYTAHVTMSVGGQMQDTNVSGSIQVNSDCTGTDTYTSGSLQGSDRLVILDSGNEMRWMPTKHPLGPAAGQAYFRRIAFGDPLCTSDMVRGVYAGWREGTLLMPVPGQPQPAQLSFSAMVTATFQYGGNGAASSTASMGGTMIDFDFPKISMQVNADCSATMNWSGVSKQFPGQAFAGAIRYIVLNYGNELIGLDISSDGSSIVIENDKRTSVMPADR